MQVKTYACYNKDDEIRKCSSSGAVFSLLASYVIANFGVVYGAAMSGDCYSAEFIRVTCEEGIAKLRGSKYLQVKMGNTYKKIREDLKVGNLVLFTGTGCQVNGLKYFLNTSNISQDKLLCVDVLCHGVPSPVLWKEYAEYREEQQKGKLQSVKFRCKDLNWSEFGMKETIRIGDSHRDEEKKIFISKDKDPFMLMFLRDYCLRPSCYECQAKEKKMSDLTMGDFWGVQKVAPEMNDGKGTSLVLIRTEKGAELFKQIVNQMNIKEVPYQAGVRSNPVEYKSVARPMQRDTFFTDMNNVSFEELEKKYAVPVKVPLKTKVKRVAKHIISNFLRGDAI